MEQAQTMQETTILNHSDSVFDYAFLNQLGSVYLYQLQLDYSHHYYVSDDFSERHHLPQHNHACNKGEH